MKRLLAIPALGLTAVLGLAACGSSTTSASSPAHSTVAAAPQTSEAVQAAPAVAKSSQSSNAVVCAAFNTQSAAYQAPAAGSSDSPADNQASDSKFLGQVSQDAYNSTGTVHAALTSFASAFADYMSVTAQGEATQAEISALNTAGSAVDSACGH